MNLLLLVVVLLDVKDFFVHEEAVYVPVLSVPLEETLCSCPSDRLQSKSEDVYLWEAMHCHVLIVPDEAKFSVFLRVRKFENSIFHNCEEQSQPHDFP
jgi:hypothetical protein